MQSGCCTASSSQVKKMENKDTPGCLTIIIGFIVISLIMNKCQKDRVKSAAFDLMQDDPDLSTEEAEEMAEELMDSEYY